VCGANTKLFTNERELLSTMDMAKVQVRLIVPRPLKMYLDASVLVVASYPNE
jgi:hypothetical protein